MEILDDGIDKTYKETAENAILPWQISDAVLLRHRVHNVQEREEPRRLHGHPRDAAGDVEAAFHRCLAHAIPLDDPLQGAKLHHSLACMSLFHTYSR